ncbi:hypothetical protein HWV62_41 [Athelia sp. TMB]|nr:hypothetical protein HWV62_41 [Athelia sp. TMB]
MSDIAYSQFTDLGLAMTPVGVHKSDDPLSVMRRPPMEAKPDVAASPVNAFVSGSPTRDANNESTTPLLANGLFDIVLKIPSSGFRNPPIAASPPACLYKHASSSRSTTCQPLRIGQVHYEKLTDLVHFHAGVARNTEGYLSAMRQAPPKEANTHTQTPSGHVHTSTSGHTRNRKTTVWAITDLGFIESAVARDKNDPLSAMRRAGIKDGDGTIPPTSNSTLAHVKFTERSNVKPVGVNLQRFEVPLTTAESDSDDTSSLDDMLNPGTPLSYLSPADAASYAVSADIFFFTVGALTWDWLMSMPDEWRVLFIGGISTSKIAYFCSRVFALAYCICSCIITVAPVKNCQALVVANAILIVLALNANNILFFVRVRAVWGKSARITTFFGFCYLAVFSTSMLIPFALNASHILPTNYCMVDPAKIWIAAPMLCNAANDALVFFAISYRITLQSMDGGGRCSKFRRFFRGDGAGHVAKELLYNGQLCYFATMAINIVQIVLALYVPEYETVLSASVIALENAMTCRVHRAVILGLIKDSEKAPVLTTVVTSGSTLMDYELDVKSRLEQREGQIGPIT